MKFTLSWLKRHLDTNASLDEICETLTAIGLEVEEVIDQAEKFAPFKVAYVESAEQHPDADRLRVCRVKTENGTVQVVCGAPNAKTGMKGIFAPSGSYIPGLDVTLKPTKIRGVESNGMLVSEREMCLSDEHNGIIELEDADKWDVGTPMTEVFGMDDPVIDIALTPNRADCAGIRGIARDLAAAGLGTLKPLSYEAPHDPVQGDFDSKTSIKIEDEDGCKHFIGREVRNIENKPSPAWMRNILKAVGLRPISALVDITNFMSLDHARPLHIYDLDKLKGGIVVRQTKTGEELAALDKKTYEVTQGAVGITDESGLIGLGGVVGGASTGVDENTKNILIESAYFNPMRIARGGRDMQINSDARYRFERGVDPAFTDKGMNIATALVKALCGTNDTKIGTKVVAGQAPDNTRTIAFNTHDFNALMGMDEVKADKQMNILTALGFNYEADHETKTENNGKAYSVTPPSWRDDIHGKADLVEEIARIYGFDKIPAVSVSNTQGLRKAPETLLQNRARMARTTLAARGLNECVTWSFMSAERADAFGANDNKSLKLSNPISNELDTMRPSILPNLIEAAGRNNDRGYSNCVLFEVGPVFSSASPQGQKAVAAGIRAGAKSVRHWADDNAARASDIYDVKADALDVLSAIGAPEAAQISRDAPAYYHPGRSGTIRLGKNVLAYFGDVHPAVLDSMDIKTPLSAFEVFIENVPASKGPKSTNKKLLALNPFQPLTKDFAFVVTDETDAQDVLKAAMQADKNLIEDGYIFDIYKGKGVEDGHKSVAVNLTIQPKDETLTEKDLEALMNKIVTTVKDKTGGVLRG